MVGVLNTKQGHCTNIPYSQNILSNAKLEKWHLHEVNHAVFIYYHSANQEPNFSLPEINECYSKDWVPLKKLSWQFKSTVYKVSQNGIDMPHDVTVHRFAKLGVATITQKDIFLSATIRDLMVKKIFGVPIYLEFDITQYGPGFSYLVFSKPYIYSITASTVPLDESTVIHRMIIWTKKNTNPFSRLLIKHAVISNFKKDLAIWEKQIDISPKFCREDLPMVEHRRWFFQFCEA